jgi:hypothetical protein
MHTKSKSSELSPLRRKLLRNFLLRCARKIEIYNSSAYVVCIQNRKVQNSLRCARISLFYGVSKFNKAKTFIYFLVEMILHLMTLFFEELDIYFYIYNILYVCRGVPRPSLQCTNAQWFDIGTSIFFLMKYALGISI